MRRALILTVLVLGLGAAAMVTSDAAPRVLGASAHATEHVGSLAEGSYKAVTYKLVSHSKKKDVPDYNHRLAVCAGNTAQNCHIGMGRSATRSIQSGFSLSRGWVASQLNISASKTVSVDVSCNRKISANQKLEAFPLGSRHKYKIRKTTTSFAGTYVTTSGWKYTYNPYAGGIYCRLSKK